MNPAPRAASWLTAISRWPIMASVISIPIAIAAVRGIRRGYLPIGDNALIEIRGRDVLTEHHPLLGTWSSASITAGVDVNHPGPLIFDLVALPVKIFGGGPGIALAIAAFNIAMVWVIGAASARVGGDRWAAVAMLVTASVVWSLGSEMLYDPWQPNVLVLAFLAVLVTVWGVLAGRHGLLIGAVAIASFAVQTHLGYIYLAPVLVAVAVVVVVGRAVRHRSPSDLKILAWSAAVGLVAWSQPLVEQVTAERGNLWRLATADSTAEGMTTGSSLAIRLVAAVVALPPWWGRSGYASTIPDNTWYLGAEERLDGLVALGPAVVALMLVVAGVVAVIWWCRADRVVVAGGVTALLSLMIGLVTVAITPVGVLGISAHRVRWLWPIAAFIALVLLGAVVTRVRWRPVGEPGADRISLAMMAIIVAFAGLTVPAHAQPSGPVASAADTWRIAALVDGVGRLEGRGVVLFDAGGMRFAEPYTAPVMAALQRNGIRFVLDEEGLVRQMGERRRYDGRADVLVYVREGMEAHEVGSGAERIAFVSGIDDAERAELIDLRRVLADRYPSSAVAEVLDPVDDLAELGAAAWRGEVDLEPLLGPAADRFIDLQYRWVNRAVAIFVEPHHIRSDDQP